MQDINHDSGVQIAPERNRIGLMDWAMLALAVFSVALLVYEMFLDDDHSQLGLILRIDYAICVIFAVEFTWRWRKDEWRWSFVKRNWYEVLGMIPVSHPAIRSFRLFRVVRIIIILSRMGRAADRVYGQDFTYRLMSRFKTQIVQAIGGTITLYVLNEVSQVLKQGHYTRNVAAALEIHGDEIEGTVIDKLKDDPSLGRLKRMPFFDDVVTASARVTQRVIVEFLRDPRTDELVADILRENIEQLRDSVKAREDAKAGAPTADPEDF